MELPYLDEHPVNEAIALFVLRPEHVDARYLHWMQDKEVLRFLESRHVIQNHESICAFVAGALVDPDTLMMGIRHRATDTHIGNIKIGPVNRAHGTGEIGLMLGERAFWGQGIGRTAIRGICDVAREHFGVRKATASASADNPGSINAFLAAGFEIEGRRRAQLATETGTEDQILLGRILRGRHSA